MTAICNAANVKTTFEARNIVPPTKIAAMNVSMT